MTQDLYSVKDVKTVREFLLKEQNGLDLLTGIQIPDKYAVLDHCHDDDQLIRGVLHRQCNAVLGKIENLWTRYLSYWYPYNLQTFLRQAADYLDREQDTRFRHPNFQKKLKIWFNKLTSKQQNEVLKLLGGYGGANSMQRKDIFSKLILDKKLTFVYIREVINKVKES